MQRISLEGMTPVQVLQAIRERIRARGAKTRRGLSRAFRAFDSFDGNKKVDAREFFSGLCEIGVDISEAESKGIMALFDKDGDGCVDIKEFLVAIQGAPSERRMDVIKAAFLVADKDCSGVIDVHDLKGRYNASMHPKVQAGKMTEDEVFLEFLQNFGDRNKDGTISLDEWIEYYAAVSADIDDEDHFVLLITKAWGLDKI